MNDQTEYASALSLHVGDRVALVPEGPYDVVLNIVLDSSGVAVALSPQGSGTGGGPAYVSHFRDRTKLYIRRAV